MSGPNRPSLRSSVRSVPISTLHLQGAGQVGQGHLEPGEIDGLGEVVGDAVAKGVHRGLHARVAR